MAEREPKPKNIIRRAVKEIISPAFLKELAASFNLWRISISRIYQNEQYSNAQSNKSDQTSKPKNSANIEKQVEQILKDLDF